MGFWFFLTVVVAGNMALKAYKWRSLSTNHRRSDHRVEKLERELQELKDKVHHLDEAVFLGDFELNRQFKDLERESSKKF